MRYTQRLVAAALAGALMCTTPALAEGGDKPGKEGKAGKRERPNRDGGARGERGPRGDAQFSRLAELLELTAEQKTQFDTIVAAHNEQVASLREQNKEQFEAARQKVQQARESQDRDAMMAARKAMMEANQGAADARKQTLEKIKAILTPEQAAKLEQHAGRDRARGPRGERGARGLNLEVVLAKADDLGLTSEQRQQVQQAQETLRQAMSSVDGKSPDGRRQRMEAVQAMQTKLREILTEDQIAKLADARPQRDGAERKARGEGKAGKKGERRGQADSE